MNVGLVRARLHAAQATLKSAEAMPWPDQLAIIREDHSARFCIALLPPAEGVALRAEFGVETNRLCYSILEKPILSGVPSNGRCRPEAVLCDAMDMSPKQERGRTAPPSCLGEIRYQE